MLDDGDDPIFLRTMGGAAKRCCDYRFTWQKYLLTSFRCKRDGRPGYRPKAVNVTDRSDDLPFSPSAEAT